MTPFEGVEYFGDEGQWIMAYGHVDLDQFTHDADTRAYGDGMSPGDLPSDSGPARHVYLRDKDGQGEYFVFCADVPGAWPMTCIDTGA